MNILLGSFGRQRFSKIGAFESLVQAALTPWPDADYAVIDLSLIQKSEKAAFLEPVACCSRPERVLPIIKQACQDPSMTTLAQALAHAGPKLHLPLILQIDDDWIASIPFHEDGSGTTMFLLLIASEMRALLDLLQSLRDTLTEFDKPPPPRRGALAPREIEVALWLCEGKTSAEIALLLGIKEHTVNDYIKTATQKLGVSNRVHFVATAMRLGLIT